MTGQNCMIYTCACDAFMGFALQVGVAFASIILKCFKTSMGARACKWTFEVLFIWSCLLTNRILGHLVDAFPKICQWHPLLKYWWSICGCLCPFTSYIISSADFLEGLANAWDIPGQNILSIIPETMKSWLTHAGVLPPDRCVIQIGNRSTSLNFYPLWRTTEKNLHAPVYVTQRWLREIGGLIGRTLVPYGIVQMQIWPNDTAQMIYSTSYDNSKGVADCSPSRQTA